MLWWFRKNGSRVKGVLIPPVSAVALCLLALLAAFLVDMVQEPALAADWAVTPGIELKAEYNDNVLFIRDKYAIDDFILRAIPSIHIEANTEKLHFSLHSDLTGEDYVDHSELDALNSSNKAQLIYMWSEKFQTTIDGHFIKDETLEDELETAGLRAWREKRYRYGGDISGQYAISDILSVTMGGGPEFVRYPEDMEYLSRSRYPDLDSWHLFFDPSLAIDDRDSIGLYINYNYADYEDSSNIKTLSGHLYFRRDLSETAYFILGCGYRYTWTKYNTYKVRLSWDPGTGLPYYALEKDRESSGDGNLIFNAELNNDWTERFSTKASAARIQYNSTDARSVDLTYTRLNLRYKITETLSSNLRLSYDHTNEDGPYSTDTDSVQVAPYLKWSLTPDLALKFGGSYRYSKEDGWYDDYNIERFTGWISLSYSYPRFLANH